MGTDAFNKAVSQETLTLLTSQLLNGVFHEEPVFVESPEYILGYSAHRNQNQRGDEIVKRLIGGGGHIHDAIFHIFPSFFFFNEAENTLTAGLNGGHVIET